MHCSFPGRCDPRRQTSTVAAPWIRRSLWRFVAQLNGDGSIWICWDWCLLMFIFHWVNPPFREICWEYVATFCKSKLELIWHDLALLGSKELFQPCHAHESHAWLIECHFSNRTSSPSQQVSGTKSSKLCCGWRCLKTCFCWFSLCGFASRILQAFRSGNYEIWSSHSVLPDPGTEFISWWRFRPIVDLSKA